MMLNTNKRKNLDCCKNRACDLLLRS